MKNKDENEKTILKAIEMLRMHYYQKNLQRKHVADIIDLLSGIDFE